MKVSIVIGTCGLRHGLVRCIESICDNTNMDDKEIIVVGNGADDDTKIYIRGLKSSRVKSIWYDERLGYPAAYNRGIEASSGEIVILLNDDTVVLDRSWMADLLTPFKRDPSVGITGPMKFSWECGGTYREALAFWCVAVKREVFDSVGLLDEAFSPGMGEDADLCIKARAAGFRLVQVPEDGIDDFGSKSRNLHFMLFHKGNGTFGEDSEFKNAAILKNNEILRERYGRKVSGRGYSGI